MEKENQPKKLYLVFHSCEERPKALEKSFERTQLDSQEILWEGRDYATGLLSVFDIECEIEIDDQFTRIELEEFHESFDDQFTRIELEEFHERVVDGSRFWVGKQEEGEASRLGFSIRVNVTEIQSQNFGRFNYCITATLSPYNLKKNLKAPDPFFLPSQRRRAS